MKKTIAMAMTLTLAATMSSSLAFVIGPSVEAKSQLNLKSMKAVDIPSSISGIRSYADIVDTARLYQANEIISFATTLEVTNLAKNPTLTSIDGKDIGLIIGSSTSDLSYANYAPAVASAVMSANTLNPSNVLVISERIDNGAIKYDNSTGQIEVKLKGVARIDSDLPVNQYQTLQSYAAKNKGTYVEIPALNVKDYNIGNSTLIAPQACEYTIITTGLTRDAKIGEVEARLRISGAEKFTKVSGKFEVNSYFNSLYSLVIKNNFVVDKWVKEGAKGTENNSPLLYGDIFKLSSALNDDKKGDYRDEQATIIAYDVYSYDSSASGNRGEYIITLFNEYAPNPSYLSSKALGMTYEKRTKVEPPKAKKEAFVVKDVGDRFVMPNAPKIDSGTANSNLILAKRDLETASIKKAFDVAGGAGATYAYNMGAAGTDADCLTAREKILSTSVSTIEKAYDAYKKAHKDHQDKNTSATSGALRTAATDLFDAFKAADSISGLTLTLTDVTVANLELANNAAIITSVDAAKVELETASKNSKIALTTAKGDQATLNSIVNLEKKVSEAQEIYENALNNVYNSSLTASANARLASAFKFFSFDFGMNTGYAVKDLNFEAKGSPAVYTDSEKGTYRYGKIDIIEEEVEEPTEEEEELEDEEIEEEEIPEEEIPEEKPDKEVPKTGDFSAGMAGALAASAAIAAAALGFIMKKREN